MKYKDFDSFKINEAKLINSKTFSDYEVEGDHKCESTIFKLFPKHKFAMIFKSRKCYVYDKSGGRVKYWDLATLEKEEGKELSQFSIIDTENGQLIKEQYEELSNLTVVDVIQYVSDDDKKKRKTKPKRMVRREWNPDDIDEREKSDELLGDDEEDGGLIMGGYFRRRS